MQEPSSWLQLHCCTWSPGEPSKDLLSLSRLPYLMRKVLSKLSFQLKGNSCLPGSQLGKFYWRSSIASKPSTWRWKKKENWRSQRVWWWSYWKLRFFTWWRRTVWRRLYGKDWNKNRRESWLYEAEICSFLVRCWFLDLKHSSILHGPNNYWRWVHKLVLWILYCPTYLSQPDYNFQYAIPRAKPKYKCSAWNQNYSASLLLSNTKHFILSFSFL